MKQNLVRTNYFSYQPIMTCKCIRMSAPFISNRIVYYRDDCLELLSTCLDWTNMAPGQSANALCARLSADPATGPCVSLRAFTDRKTAATTAVAVAQPRRQTAAAAVPQVTAPCKRNQCGSAAVCLVNRGCRMGGGRGACSPYRCAAGCKAGEVSHYLVTEHSYVRVPTFNGQKGCAKACQCTARGFERCQQLPCAQAQACWLAGRQIGKRPRAFARPIR